MRVGCDFDTREYSAVYVVKLMTTQQSDRDVFQLFLVCAVQTTEIQPTKCEKDTRCNSYECWHKCKRYELNNNPTSNVRVSGMTSGLFKRWRRISSFLAVKLTQKLKATLMEGRIAGNQFKTLTLEKPRECAKECDKEDNCISCEISLDLNWCERNRVGQEFGAE